jgi:hypothetical protein
MTVMTFFCGSPRCRKLLAAQVVAVEQPRIQTPQSGNLIVT